MTLDSKRLEELERLVVDARNGEADMEELSDHATRDLPDLIAAARERNSAVKAWEHAGNMIGVITEERDDLQAKLNYFIELEDKHRIKLAEAVALLEWFAREFDSYDAPQIEQAEALLASLEEQPIDINDDKSIEERVPFPNTFVAPANTQKTEPSRDAVRGEQ